MLLLITTVASRSSDVSAALRTNHISLPRMINVDFSIHKQICFKESCSIELRPEFFNLFNYYNPDPGTVDLGIRNKTFSMAGGGVELLKKLTPGAGNCPISAKLAWEGRVPLGEQIANPKSLTLR